MQASRRHAWMLLIATTAAAGLASAQTQSTRSGQDYPARPIRFVTAAVGGGIDVTARLLAAGLTERLNQQVIVDNRGGTNVAMQTVAKAAPDGYTLLVHNNTVWISRAAGEGAVRPREGAVADHAHVALAQHPGRASVACRSGSVKELIALAKANPGKIDYASGPIGASNHLAAEVFKAMAGIDLVRIGYKGGGPALNDVLAGQVKVMFATSGSVTRARPVGQVEGPCGHERSSRHRSRRDCRPSPPPACPVIPPKRSTASGHLRRRPRPS